MICIRRCERADLRALEWDGAFSADRLLIAATFARSEQGACEMLVAEDIVIVGQVWVDLDREPDGAWLWALRVKPAWQGRGIATALIETAEQLAAACAMRWTLIEVEPENLPARTLCERRGYVHARTSATGAIVLRKQIARPARSQRRARTAR